MRIGIISDVHGNLESLHSSITLLKKQKVDFLSILGDTVGYGPDPERCLEIIKEGANFILRGNHEEGIIKDDYTTFNDVARTSLKWTKNVLSPDSLNFIKQLEEKAEFEDILFVHASISSPLFKYIIKENDAKEEFALLNKKLCFIGHTHIPAGYRKREGDDRIEVIHPNFSGRMEIEINQEYRYIINVGSTGQPRDGLPFACVSIYDTEGHMFNLYRLEYPAELTAKKIIDNGLPSVLARRVIQGI